MMWIFFNVICDTGEVCGILKFAYLGLLTYLLHGAEPFLRSYLVLQLVKKFPAFLEPESSSPYSQVPATCPCPEPTPSSPHNLLPVNFSKEALLVEVYVGAAFHNLRSNNPILTVEESFTGNKFNMSQPLVSYQYRTLIVRQ